MKKILGMMVVFAAVGSFAETYTWTGAADDGGIYQTPGNWDQGAVPTANDDIVIESGDVVYDAAATVGGGDWYRNAGSTFTMKGGTFTQIGGPAWMQISGALVIEGGAFSMGSSQQLNLNSSASITISGGSFAPNGVNVSSGGTISMTGGEYVVNGNYTIRNDSGMAMSSEAVMTISGELLTGGGKVTLGEGNYVCGLVNGGGVLNLDGSSLHSKGGAICGINNGTKVNFVSFNDNAGSYTYNGTDASEVYSRLFASGTITLDGAPIDEEDFTRNFQVSSTETTITIQLVIIPTSWRVAINSVTDVTDSSAKARVTVLKAVGETASLRYALGATKAEVQAAALADMTLVKEGVFASEQFDINLTDLEANAAYYLGFFLVNGNEIVATSKVTSFVATVYDNIYINGAWTNGQPEPGQRLLFKESFSIPQAGWNERTFGSFDIDVGSGKEVHVEGYTGITLSGSLIIRSGTVTVDGTSFLRPAKLVMAGGYYAQNDGDNFNSEDAASRFEFNGGTYVRSGECNSGNKVPFNRMCVTASGYTNGGAPFSANASRFRSTRRDRRGDLPYGLYLDGNFFNFVPGTIEENVVPPSCGYAWTYDFATEEGETVEWPARTDEQILEKLFTEGRITLNGETVTSEEFAEKFVVYTDEVDHSQLVTMFTTFDSTTKGALTLMNGAVVRLSERTALSGLAINGADSIVDLNGKRLSVSMPSAFIINGTTIPRGSYTAAELNELAGTDIFCGEGNISVGQNGFILYVR